MSNIATAKFDQLVIEGRLVPARFFVTPNDAVLMTGTSGNFDIKAFNSAGLIFNGISDLIVEPYRRYCDGKRAIVFCNSVAHAEKAALNFCHVGIPANTILGDQGAHERALKIRNFDAGKLMVLVTVYALLDESLPAADAVIIAAPTNSKARFHQMVSKAMFPRYVPGMPRNTVEQRLASIAASDKQEAIVLDVAGNCLRHGLTEL